jgi:hypothetical protein
MTAQICDEILIAGEKFALRAEPLEDYWSETHPSPFIGFKSSCWRGYSAKWAIYEDCLYLVEVSKIREIFPGTSGKIKADWYTGELKIAKGELLEYIHSGYDSIFEEETIFYVKDGKIINKEILNNKLYYGLRDYHPRFIFPNRFSDFGLLKQPTVYERVTNEFTIKNCLYFFLDVNNIFIRHDVKVELERVLKRGMLYDEAIAYLKYNIALETANDRVIGLIELFKLSHSWQEKEKILGKIANEFKDN